MADYTLPAEKEVIQTILDEKDRIKRGRHAWEKQWLVNIAFLYGKQHFTIENKPSAGLDERINWEIKNLERKNRVRRTSNYILPLFRAVLSKMILMKSTVSIDATTNSDRDRNAARVSKEAIEDFWQNVNKSNPSLSQRYTGMDMVRMRLLIYLLAMGGGYLKPYFNPKAKSKAFLQDKIIPEAEIGEVEVKVFHLFNIYRDPLRRSYIEEDIVSVDEIKDIYGKDVEPEELELCDHEKRLIALLESPYEAKYKDAVKKYEKWELPSNKNPRGKYAVFTEKKMLYEGDLPSEYRGKLPYFEFNYLDFLLSPFAQGMIDQLIPLQEDYNFTLTRLAGYKKWFTGKIMIPRGSKISTKWDDQIGQIIFYNAGHGTPQYQTAPNPPSFLVEDLYRIRRDMEDIASAHDSSMGRVPGGVKSGIGIQGLTELDNSAVSPNIMEIEQKFSFFVEIVLNIMQEKYTEGRFLAITSDEFISEVKSFLGSDLAGNYRIKVSLGSSLPASKEARQQKIMELSAQGFITKDKARELLEFGDIEGVFHSLDETAEKMEIQQLLREDIQVIAEPWEEHNVRVKVLTDFMKSQEYMRLPEMLRQKFIAHLQEHQQYITQEQQAAASMTARPAAMPPGQGA